MRNLMEFQSYKWLDHFWQTHHINIIRVIHVLLGLDLGPNFGRDVSNQLWSFHFPFKIFWQITFSTFLLLFSSCHSGEKSPPLQKKKKCCISHLALNNSITSGSHFKFMPEYIDLTTRSYFSWYFSKMLHFGLNANCQEHVGFIELAIYI